MRWLREPLMALLCIVAAYCLLALIMGAARGAPEVSVSQAIATESFSIKCLIALIASVSGVYRLARDSWPLHRGGGGGGQGGRREADAQALVK